VDRRGQVSGGERKGVALPHKPKEKKHNIVASTRPYSWGNGGRGKEADQTLKKSMTRGHGDPRTEKKWEAEWDRDGLQRPAYLLQKEKHSNKTAGGGI